MGIFCYCSKIQEGKSDAIRAHWADKLITDPRVTEAERSFWQDLQMSGFESWIQPKHNVMIHCLEGVSLDVIFTKLREKIHSGDSMALKLHTFYLDVLGKDYKDPGIEPRIECLLDITIDPPDVSTKKIKKGFVYPLLAQKEQEHRSFRRECMGAMRKRHEASMQAFGVYCLKSWLQTTPENIYIVCYSEREAEPEKANDRLLRGKKSAEWQTISKSLMDQTGLAYEDLSPEVEWLTGGRYG